MCECLPVGTGEKRYPWVAYGENADTKVTITGEGSTANIVLDKPTTTDATAYLPANAKNFKQIRENKLAYDISYNNSGATGSGTNLYLTYTWVTADNAGYIATTAGNKLILQFIDTDAGSFKVRAKFGDSTVNGGALQTITPTGDVTGFVKGTTYRVVYETVADSTATNGYTTYVYFGGQLIGSFNTPANTSTGDYQTWYTGTEANCGLIFVPGGSADFDITINTKPEDTKALAGAVCESFALNQKYPGVGQVAAEARAAYTDAIIAAWNSAAGTEDAMLKAAADLEAAQAAFEVACDEAFDFYAANLSLAENISINFKVKKDLFGTDSTYSDPYVTFEVNGVTETVREYRETSTYYVFIYDRVAPHMTGKTVTATLHGTHSDDTPLKGEPLEYSVQKYCQTIFTMYPDANAAVDDANADIKVLKVLLADLLYYADKSQIYAQSNTDTMATDILTEAQKAYATPESTDLKLTDQRAFGEEPADAVASWSAASLFLEESVTVRFKFTVTDDISKLKMKVAFADDPDTSIAEITEFTLDEKGRYVADFSGLNPAQMREPIVVTICRKSDGQAVSKTLTYSIESYAYAKQNVTTRGLGELVKAMMRYGDSTAAYVTEVTTEYFTTPDVESLRQAVRDIAAMSATAGEGMNYVIDLADTTYELDQTIYFNDVSNVTINGNGADIIVTDLVPAMQFLRCKNVLLNELSVDYDPLPYVQGVVTSIAGDHSIVVDVDDGYEDKYSIDYLNDTKGYRDGSIFLAIHDRETGAPAVNTRSYYRYKDAVDNGDGTITLPAYGWYDIPDGGTALKVGDVVTAFPYTCSVFNINDSDTVDFTDVNVYSSGLSVFRINGGEGNNHLTNVQVVPGEKPEGAIYERLKAVNGDIVHAIDIAKGPTIENSTLTHSGDDILNVHGYFLHVLAVNGNTVTVTPKWKSIQDVGDTVEIFEADNYASKGTATIVEFKRYDTDLYKEEIAAIYANCNHGYASDTLVYDITLDSIPNVKAGDHLVSLNAVGSGATIRNSHFGYNSANGLLIRGHNVVIENCTFTNISGAAVKVVPGLSWCEGGFANNVTIRNNTFTNICTGVDNVHAKNVNMGAVTLSIEPMLNNTTTFFECHELKDIIVEGNTFTNVRTHGISAINCSNIAIKNNVIINPLCDGVNDVGSLYDLTANSGIFVGMSKNITVTGNAVVAKGAGVLYPVTIHENCSGTITNSGNTLNEKIYIGNFNPGTETENDEF